MNTSNSNSPPDSTLVDTLRRLLRFDTADAPGCEALAQRAVHRQFGPDQMLLVEGDPSGGLWIIERGRVKVFKLSPDGREHILHLFGPGDSFNEIPALDGGPNPANAATVSVVTAWVIPSEAVVEVIEKKPALAMRVVRVLGERVRMLVGQIEGLALRSVTGRLARFLLDRVEQPAFGGPEVTRAMIAAHLATTPETVSRALRTLEEAGAIRFDRHRIVIVNSGILSAIAG
jgi:CRP-like cAMP-binding protein